MYDITEIIAEAIVYLEKAQSSDNIEKWDACEEIRRRLCIIMQKMVSMPVVSNFAMPLLVLETDTQQFHFSDT
jgi:hypothetical protein